MKFYLDLIKQAGEPGAPNAGFSECLTAYSQGQAAMWYDATVAAGLAGGPQGVQGRRQERLRPGARDGDEVVGLAVGLVARDPHHRQGPRRRVGLRQLGDLQGVHPLVGERLGWERVPPGSRQSTYEIPEFVQASSGAAEVTLDALKTIDPNRATKRARCPTPGIQYVQIPEFQDLGTSVSSSSPPPRRTSVEDALKAAQGQAEEVADAGYQD